MKKEVAAPSRHRALRTEPGAPGSFCSNARTVFSPRQNYCPTSDSYTGFRFTVQAFLYFTRVVRAYDRCEGLFQAGARKGHAKVQELLLQGRSRCSLTSSVRAAGEGGEGRRRPAKAYCLLTPVGV